MRSNSYLGYMLRLLLAMLVPIALIFAMIFLVLSASPADASRKISQRVVVGATGGENTPTSWNCQVLLPNVHDMRLKCSAPDADPYWDRWTAVAKVCKADGSFFWSEEVARTTGMNGGSQFTTSWGPTYSLGNPSNRWCAVKFYGDEGNQLAAFSWS